MKHVFIIGSKGIPASYGGFETFVEKLTQYRVSNDIYYHISCLSDNNSEFEYNKARCFNVKVFNLGPAKAIYYDVLAFTKCIHYIKKNRIKDPIIYVLACRIGPFIGSLERKLHRLGGVLYVNPDGHEWKRGKWNKIVQQYWKLSERLMVKYANLIICDSKTIEKYIKEMYSKYQPNTKFIAYGAEVKKSKIKDDEAIIQEWYKKNGLKEKEYYLIVGRFVPENNFEVMIREFMISNSKKDLVIITTANDDFLEKLEKMLHFRNDLRIKFVGTVYDQELLKKIRENAYGYFHGHEVGGTNPSLLEALSSTDLNLLFNVNFNWEVGEEGAVYWTKEPENLARLIEKVDTISIEKIMELGKKAKKRIIDEYSWEHIVELYESVFLYNIN